MKVLVVGQNPSKKHGDSPTLKRLYWWLDNLDLQIVSFTNLYEGYKVEESTNQSEFIRNISSQYDRIITLGKIADRALSSMAIHHYSLPHPSGLNRQVNDLKFVHEQLRACKNYLRSDS